MMTGISRHDVSMWWMTWRAPVHCVADDAAPHDSCVPASLSAASFSATFFSAISVKAVSLLPASLCAASHYVGLSKFCRQCFWNFGHFCGNGNSGNLGEFRIIFAEFGRSWAGSKVFGRISADLGRKSGNYSGNLGDSQRECGKELWGVAIGKIRSPLPLRRLPQRYLPQRLPRYSSAAVCERSSPVGGGGPHAQGISLPLKRPQEEGH